MKKVLLITFLTSIIMLTGCKEKTETLSCIKGGKSDYFSTKQETIVTFKENKITKLENKSYTEFKEEAIEGFDIYYNTLAATLNVYKDKSGVKLDISKSKNTITTNIKFDINKVSKNESEGLIVDPNATKEQVIAELELDGYTCK